MKKFLWLAALVAALALLFTGCPNGDDEGKDGDEWSVKFDLNYSGAAAAATVKVTKGEALGTKFPAAPTRADFTFGGWFTVSGATGGDAFTKDTLVTKNMTVYARWSGGSGGDDFEPPDVYEHKLTLVRNYADDGFSAGLEGLFYNPIFAGEVFDFHLEFIVDRDLEQKLQMVMVDDSQAAGWWTPLTEFENVGESTTLYKKGVTNTVTVTMIPTIDYADHDSVKVFFDTAGLAAPGPVTIYFTKFEIDIEALMPHHINNVWELGDFTVVNAPNQQGWATNGVDGVEEGLEFETLAAAKYLVVESRGGNAGGFGGISVIMQGDGNGWAWKQTDVAPGWTSYARPISDTVYTVIDLSMIDTFDEIITGSEAKFFIQMYPLGDWGLKRAYLVTKNLTKPADAVNIVNGGKTFGWWTKTSKGERVTLNNNAHAVYRFDLPAGKTYGDYEFMKVDYMVDHPDELAKQVRNGRLYGAFKADDFAPGNREGYHFFYFNTSNANPYIYDQLPGISFSGMDTAGITAINTWVTQTYFIANNRAHSAFEAIRAKPADSETGPFFFGVGLPGGGQTDDVSMWIRNVRLVDYDGTEIISRSSGIAGPTYVCYMDNGTENLNRIPDWD